jgi:cation diffusion facilitator family transporter
MADIGLPPPPLAARLSFLDGLARSKLLVAIVSLLTTVVPTVTKLGLGLATGSLALMADGLQGLMDVIITMCTVLFVPGAAQPASALWTNGREELEALAALIEAAVLIVIAVCIWYLAAQKLVFGHQFAEIESWHLAVVLVAILADGLRARYVGWVARQTHSLALEANAAHFRTDALGSLIVLLGLVLAHQGWPQADTLATLGLAGFLSWTAWRIGSRAATVLLDIADPAESNAVPEVLQSHPDTRAVPTLRLHRRLRGSDIVARVVVAPDQVPHAASIAAALEAGLLAIGHICSANVAVEVQSLQEQDESWAQLRQRVPGAVKTLHPAAIAQETGGMPADNPVTRSMSRSCNARHTSAMESFFSSPRTERTVRKVCRTHNASRADLCAVIERFCNPRRRHSKPGSISPMSSMVGAMPA